MGRSSFEADIKASNAQEADFTKLRELAAPALKPPNVLLFRIVRQLL